MLEPFIWIFKQNNWKDYFKYFGLLLLKYTPIALIMYLLSLLFTNTNHTLHYALIIIAYIVFIVPSIALQGYYWELTESIIEREWDIKTANIYNGITREIYKITLPEIKTGKFVWRGIASLVATILMVIPFFILFTSGILLSSLSNLPPYTPIFLYVFLCLFIPALLWNYAARNSVVAVWNLRKAIYLMGNYTGRYTLNTLLMLVFYTIHAGVVYILWLIFMPFDVLSALSNGNILPICTLVALNYLLQVYAMHVYAYLLGTIASAGEQ